jgi:hypothetical protein
MSVQADRFERFIEPSLRLYGRYTTLPAHEVMSSDEQVAHSLRSVDYCSQALPFLDRAAEDKDALVRERAVQGLCLSGSPQAVVPVRKALKDPDEFVRWRAVQALGRLGAMKMIDDLAPLVEDPNWHVRVTILELLGTISRGQPKA